MAVTPVLYTIIEIANSVWVLYYVGLKFENSMDLIDGWMISLPAILDFFFAGNTFVGRTHEKRKKKKKKGKKRLPAILVCV